MGLFNKKDKVKEDKNKSTEDKKVEAKETSETKKTVKKVAKVKKTGEREAAPRAYKILLKPVISEKATVGVSQNKYVFEVSKRANKVEVKKAVEETYNVVPSSVNIVNRQGKKVRFGRTRGEQSDSKRAIVTLKKGDTIKLYEGI